MNSILDIFYNYYILFKSTIKNNIFLIIFLIIIFSFISYYLYTTTLQTYFDKNSNKEYIPKKTQKKNEATIYYFYTTWCPHCTEATPHIDELENEIKIMNKSQKNIIIFLRKIDCDKSNNEKLLKKYNVEGFPTIVLDHNNKIYNYEAKPNSKHLKDFVKDSLNIKDV
tara:strand:- start:4370 stop:4873 length:504 start_codon:yes stop_codon:yes gene_type:complete